MTNIIELDKRLFEEDVGTIIFNTARNLVNQCIKYVINKIDRASRDQYDYGVIDSFYEALFRNEVRRALRRDRSYQVIELSASELERFDYIDEHTGERKRGLLGFREDTPEGTRIYIPREDEVGKLLGENLTPEEQRQVYLGIEVHERMEASSFRPRTEEEHKEFEGLILRSLETLARYGDNQAREAYKGTLRILKLRRDKGDIYYQGVNQYYPVDAALAA